MDRGQRKTGTKKSPRPLAQVGAVWLEVKVSGVDVSVVHSLLFYYQLVIVTTPGFPSRRSSRTKSAKD